MDLHTGDTVIYPAHGACVVRRTELRDAFGAVSEHVVLDVLATKMTVSLPLANIDKVGLRPPMPAAEVDDLITVLCKPDPRMPANWSRRFKNHQEKLKSGDVYQVAEVVRNLYVRNLATPMSSAERTMYERARLNLLSELGPALGLDGDQAANALDAILITATSAAKQPASSRPDSPAGASA